MRDLAHEAYRGELFGDLGHIVIRASKLMIQRHTQLLQADVTKGEWLFIGR